jgi:hypothetical protein
MKEPQTTDDRVLLKLDRVIALLEDLFILQAARNGVNQAPLRDILRIDKKRIGRIAKHVEKEEGKRNGGV